MAGSVPSLTKVFHNKSYAAIDPRHTESAKGKTVLITGGGRGIGARIAHAFAAAGASVVGITGRTASSLEATKSVIEKEYAGVQVITGVADVTDEQAIELAFQKVSATGAANGQKGISILVHNAGYLADMGGIAHAESKEWWTGFEINVLGSFYVTKSFLRHKAAENPKIIEVTTAAVVLPPIPTWSSYFTSKMAENVFFHTVAVENPDVSVFSVHPGLVTATDMGQKGTTSPELVSLGIPADDIELPAHFIAWLASDEAEFLKDRMVWCNWDVEELKAKKDSITADPGFLNFGMKGFPYQA